MKFSFRLEQVLKHRRMQEKVALQLMFKAKTELENEQRNLNQLFDSIDRARERRFELEQSSAGPLEQAYVETFILGQNMRIEKQKLRIRDFQIAFEREQDSYRDALLRVRVLENLKDKKLDEFKKKLNTQELSIMNDVLSAQYLSQQRMTE